MQKLYAISYATPSHQKYLYRFMSQVTNHNFPLGFTKGDDHIGMFPYTKYDLVHTEFYKKNQELLDEEKGAGYWIWKPFFILQTLNKIEEGDLVVYMDCGDSMVDPSGMRKFLFQRMQNTSVLLTEGAFRHGNWTKRDCFVAMDCDTEYYHDAIQLEAGIVVCKKAPETIQFIQMWLNWCLHGHVMRYNDNILGKENLPGFKEHRGDQSVLTNIFLWHKKMGFPGIESSNEMRPFIYCNQEL